MSKRNLFISILSLLCILLAIGCNNNIRVSGKVTFSDGSPLDSGKVVFENEQYSFRGKIQKDGTFRLGRLKDGDGIYRGKYRVAISDAFKQELSSDGSRVISGTYFVAEKFRSTQTSGFEYDIQKKTTDISIIVERPKSGEEKMKIPGIPKR
jgi:hypothetical protein